MKKSWLTFASAIAFTTITFSLAVRAQAQTVTTLATLNGANGYGPFSSVVQATDGNFYGTTNAGGAFGNGTLFRVSPTGRLTDLYDFCSQPSCADGSFLSSVPILGRDGTLYGVTGDGGNSNRAGTVYRMTLGGKLTTLYSFCPALPCTDGAAPTGLVQGGDGNFYGTTSVAANSNGGYGGTIFSMSPGGEIKVLYTFCSRVDCMDGDFSYYPPVLGSDGNLYGVTYTGGNQGGGLLWELTPRGSYKVLYNFCPKSGDCKDANPYLIVRDSKGNFFGMSNGNVFEFTSTHRFLVLHPFDSNTTPSWPFIGLTLANDGNIYGMSDDNSIFKVTPKGVYSKILTLPLSAGSPPVGPFFQGTDGGLYATTTYGPRNATGAVFKLSNGLSPLVETVPTAGEVGNRILILGNHLTGTTSVTFNGVPGEFKVHKDTFITAWVPTGATTGIVSVVTPSGTLNSNPQFVVTK